MADDRTPADLHAEGVPRVKQILDYDNLGRETAFKPAMLERIDRARKLAFSFDGRNLSGFAGDTVASAVMASGQRVFGRSFKYHRPRGLQCCSGHCANCRP